MSKKKMKKRGKSAKIKNKKNNTYIMNYYCNLYYYNGCG